MTQERNSHSVEGSAWDTWHLAGWNHAKIGNSTEGDDLDRAAKSYAGSCGHIGGNPALHSARAFTLGALQYVKKNI